MQGFALLRSWRTIADTNTALIRCSTRRAVSGFSCQIGFNRSMISPGVTSATGFLPMAGPARATPAGRPQLLVSYLHLAVNALGLRAAELYVGHQRAREVLAQWPYYRAIYRIVLDE